MESLGDGAVALSFRDQLKNFLFARSKISKSCVRRILLDRRIAEKMHHSDRNVRAKYSSAVSDDADRLHKLRFLSVLQDIPPRPGFHGGKYGVIIPKHRYDENLNVWILFGQNPGCL